MEAARLEGVVFCGENPHIVLVDADETITAAVSYWECTYSAYGEGHALLVYLNAANAAALDHPTLAIYSDNAPLARYLTDTLNQHFDDWQGLGFANAAIHPARFFKEADTRSFYRVACHTESGHIDLLWQDIRPPDLRLMPDLQGGGFGAAGDEHYHVVNVILLCGEGSIRINEREAVGKPQTPTRPDGRFSSSVFVAISETWVKIESAIT